jgi:ferredoxin
MAYEKLIIDKENLHKLIESLKGSEYTVVAPTMRDGAIVYDEISGLHELPIGWSDEQDGGTYRLQRRKDEAYFGFNVGPHSWKKFLHPPALKLFSAEKNESGFKFVENNEAPPKLAFIGVRACELHAMAIQDKVFLQGNFVDRTYKSRRENLFIVAVNCGQAGGTCFCTSMNTGPQATSGFDLALTEIIEPDRHYFLVEVGTELGARVVREVPHQPAKDEEVQLARSIVEKTSQQMGRSMDTTDIKELLYRNLEHPRWDEVAERCMTCANCTMVCPTCFCTTVEDVTDLSGEHAERWRTWDSCFTMDFSYIHGGSVRPSTKARYRQWMTHKLATWIDQFDTSGCVGCGRCITWCPVAIDITEEVRAIRESDEHG